VPQTDPLAQSQPGVTPQTPAAATPTPASITPADVDRLVSALDAHTKSVNSTVGNWSQQVLKATQPQQPAKPAPAADDDALTDIAGKGWAPIDQRVEAAVGKVLKDTLAPYLGAQATDAASANESAARASVDAEFGAGTYDEVFKGRVDELFGDQTASRAIKGQFDRALALVKGEKFSALADKRASAAAKRDADAKEAERVARSAPYLPGRGYIPTGMENTLSDDDREKLKAVHRATGIGPTEEEAAKLRDMLASSRGGVSLEMFNRDFPLKEQR
jgi:hypothetical protein